MTQWCNAKYRQHHTREPHNTDGCFESFIKVFSDRITTQQNFTPTWSFYFGPVLIFQSRRAEVYLIVSIRISQPVKSFIGAVSWVWREKKVVLNPRHVQQSEKFWIRPEQWSIELLRYISFKISSLDRCSKLNMEMKRILFYATLKSCRVFKSDGIVKRYDLSRNKTLVKQDCHFNRQLFQILPSEGAFLQQKCWQLNWDE